METQGNIRTNNVKEEYCSILGSDKRPFEYGFQVNGMWGVRKGKWLVDAVDCEFKRHNIVVDYSIRGIYDVSQHFDDEKEKIKVESESLSLKKRISLYCSIGIRRTILSLLSSTKRGILNFWVKRIPEVHY